ncbi:DegT/DnrJ/EryC1/StrS family aminotransferase [Proteiniborus sp.]|uniref:DegT/DnrJ/EryC1/StrS family aminotransferase n=1 Tax=Proteiniborus sp. TaxID=2079015 RepID=UPI003325B49E
MGKNIYVTKPFLPPIEEYIIYLKKIWESGIVTNNGELVKRLEKELSSILKLSNLIAVANGTLGIQIAIKALDLVGEIITTPFTFIATCSSIIWQNCTPIFVDIDPETLNIDSDKIEPKITRKTSAILGVHVFSNPCDVKSINNISKKHNLKVIYDAAHSLFVDYEDKSILDYGDISVVSFHAVKFFNTVEGGACITQSKELAERIRQIRNFGFNENGQVTDIGINAKMSELHAAMGLASLKYIEEIRKKRKDKYNIYKKLLSNNKNIKFQKINTEQYNYSYMPVIFSDETILLSVLDKLNKNSIFPRRYFYPSLNNLKISTSSTYNLPIAENISRRILCLPLYNNLEDKDIEFICKLINTSF